MGAPGTRARTPGTGSVKLNRKCRSPFEARLPREAGSKTYGQLLGRYDSAWHAHRALDRWCEERKAS